jgi:hypothetical protein
MKRLGTLLVCSFIGLCILIAVQRPPQAPSAPLPVQTATSARGARAENADNTVRGLAYLGTYAAMCMSDNDPKMVLVLEKMTDLAKSIPAAERHAMGAEVTARIKQIGPRQFCREMEAVAAQMR